MKRKWIVIIPVALVIVGGLAFGGLALADRDAWIAKYKDTAAARASEELGRELRVGEVQTSLIPFGAKVRGLSLAGADGTEPQVQAAELEVGFRALAAILSFGQRLEVSHLTLRGLELRAKRDAEGRWDFDDILAKRAAKPDDGQPTDLGFLKGAKIARVAVEDAKIVLDDAALGRPLAVEGVGLSLEDIALGKPLRVRGAMTLVDGDRKSPIELDATLTELPETLSFDPVPAARVAVKASSLELGPWAGLMPEGGLAPAAGVVDVDVEAKLGAGLASLDTRGTARARGLALRGPKGKGAAADLDVRWDLEQADSGRIEVRALEVKGAGVDLKTALVASRPALAGVERADVNLSVAELAKVMKLLPPGSDIVPEELRLAGPLSASLSGAPAEGIELALDLDRARVRYSDVLDKAPGRALHAKLKAKRAGELLEVKPLTIALDSAVITGDAQLPLSADAPFAASLKSGKVQLASLKAMVPPFAKALARGDKVEGNIAFAATAKPEAGRQRLNAALTLTGADVKLAGSEARGKAVLRAHLKPKGEQLDVELVLDAKALALASRTSDGEKILDKAAGTPLNVDLVAAKKGDVATLSRAELIVGGTRVVARGQVSELDKAPKLDLSLGDLDVRFDDLRRAVPGAASLPAGGRLRGQVKLRGTTDHLEVRASGLDVRFGDSKVKGRANLAALEPLELADAELEVDLRPRDLASLSDAVASLPADARYAGSVKARGHLDHRFSADLVASALEAGGSTLRGTAKLRNLDRPQVDFDLRGDDVDVDAFLDAFPKDDDEPDENPHGLSSGARETLRTVSGKGTLRAKRVRFKGLPMRNFVGELTMTNGKVDFRALDFTFYDGRVSGAGTSLDLPAERTGYNLKLAIKGLDLNAALDAHTKVPPVFTGKVDQVINLTGAGLSKLDLVKTLDGPVDLAALSLGFQSLDVASAIFAPLARASKGDKLAKAPVGGTTLRDLKAAFTIGKGRANLQKPVTTKTRFGALRLDGGFSLEKALDLDAVAELAPSTIQRWTKGRVKPAQMIPVPFKIGGTWAKPRITGVDAKALIAAAAGAAAIGAVDAATGGKATEVKEQAAERVDAAKKKAEDEAKRRAADAKKRADDAAKKAADAAKKKAADAKKRAERAAKKKADEAKKKAEEAARKFFGK
jgi:hypothetical protein